MLYGLMLMLFVVSTKSEDNPCTRTIEGEYYDLERDVVYKDTSIQELTINLRCKRLILTDNASLMSFMNGPIDGYKLQSLDIKDSFVPSINNNHFGGVSDFKIVNITFCNTSIVDPDFMSKFTNLEVLNLAHNELEIIQPHTFAKCKKLIHLDLAYNKLISIQNVLNVENLQKLYIQFNQLDTLNGISKLNNLRVLNTSHNYNLDPSEIHKVQWEELDISYTNTSNIVDCNHFKKVIFTSDNKLTLVCKNFAKTIVQIDYGYNFITHFNEDSFNDLDKLEVLLLDGNPLKEVGYDLFRDLKSLKLLQLQSSNLSTIPVGCFRNLHNLETLRLDSNDLTAIEPELFNGLNSLLYLDIRKNNFKHFDLNIVYPIRSLNKLYLSGIELADFNTDKFLNTFTHLKSVSFSFSNITCDKLQDILKIFTTNNIVVRQGEINNVNNINGMACK